MLVVPGREEGASDWRVWGRDMSSELPTREMPSEFPVLPALVIPAVFPMRGGRRDFFSGGDGVV